MGRLKNAITNVAGNIDARMLPKAAGRVPTPHYEIVKHTEGDDVEQLVLRCSAKVSRRLTALYGDGRVTLFDNGRRGGEDARRDTAVRRHIMAFAGDFEHCEIKPGKSGRWYVRLLAF